jgi:hypothetical protein
MISNQITDQKLNHRLFLFFLAHKRQHHFPTKSASLPRMVFRASLPAQQHHFFKGSLPALRLMFYSRITPALDLRGRRTVPGQRLACHQQFSMLQFKV